MLDIHTIAQYFTSEGQAILQAPLSFLVAQTISITVIWWIFNYLYATRINGLESSIQSLEGRIKLKDDQINDYKSKLDGATPEEARKRLDELELKLVSLLPRRLTTEQKLKIGEIISELNGSIMIARDGSCHDAAALANDIAEAFRSAKWRVSLPLVMGINTPPTSGIGLLVSDQTNLSHSETLVKLALESARIEFNIQSDNKMMPSDLIQRETVEIIITSRFN